MKYTQRYDAEWFRLPRKHYLVCCDCGLVHLVQTKLVGRTVFMRAWRDRRRTALRRRWHKVKK